MAVGDTYVDLGICYKVAVGKPATENQAGYGALTWVDVEGPISFPDRGDTVEDVSETEIKSGRAEHFNGVKDGGTREIPMKFIEGDSGQAILSAGAGTNATYSFQEVDPDGEAHFAYGRIMSFRRRQSTGSTFKGHTLMTSINSATFTGTEES